LTVEHTSSTCCRIALLGGLAFSEFRGYEDWQTISVSRSEEAVALILGNHVMIEAYKAGISESGY
jgi:hypothetical protein